MPLIKYCSERITIVIKKIPKDIYNSIAGRAIFRFEIPTEFIMIFSDPFIRPIKARIYPANVINGSV